MPKYEIIIYWSEDDMAFVAEAPELAGCAAHGSTQEEALANAQEAIRLRIASFGFLRQHTTNGKS